MFVFFAYSRSYIHYVSPYHINMKEVLKEQLQSENAIIVAVCVKKSDNIERKLDI